MCGIVGYVGEQSALDVVVAGLRRLEYRGYDSAGVAVVNSMRTHPRFRFVNDQPVPTGIENDLDECITKWMEMVERGLEFDGHPRVTLVRYEDVISDPRAQLEPVLEFVDLPWDDAVANYAEVQNASRSGRRLGHTQEAGRPVKKEAAARWQEELTEAQIRRIEDRGGALLDRFGYARIAAKLPSDRDPKHASV